VVPASSGDSTLIKHHDVVLAIRLAADLAGTTSCGRDGGGPLTAAGGTVALSDRQDHWPQNFSLDRIRPLNSV
jgi:hypothetical protein